MFTTDYYSDFCLKNGIDNNNNNEILSRFLPAAYSFSFNCSFKDKFLVTAGFGMNSEPHLLTALQIYNIVNLQKHGVETQIVFGDFDVMLARGFHYGMDLSQRYRTFLNNLGYNLRSGSARGQFDSQNVCRNMIQYSSQIFEEDFIGINEDVDVYYNGRASINFPTKISIALMVADFISLLSEHRTEHVVVLSGLDESKYPVLAEKIRQRLSIYGSIGGIFSKLVKGINGHPKMSKSHRDSGLFLTDDRSFIQRNIDSDVALKRQLEEWVPAGDNLEGVISLLIDCWSS